MVCEHVASSALFVDVSRYSNTLMVPEQGLRSENSECFRAVDGRMRVACRDWMFFLSLTMDFELVSLYLTAMDI